MNKQEIKQVKLLEFLEDILKPIAKEKQKGGQGGVLLRQNSDKVDTKKIIAKVSKVSHDTVARVKYIRDNAPELKELIKEPRAIKP